jgi:hypothetical protein
MNSWQVASAALCSCGSLPEEQNLSVLFPTMIGSSGLGSGLLFGGSPAALEGLQAGEYPQRVDSRLPGL